MDELKFQKRLIDSLEKQGGFGFKMSNRFLVGIPDLFLAIDGNTVVIECKLVSKTGNIKISKLQELKLIHMQACGVKAGWIALDQDEKNKKYNLYLGINPKARNINSVCHKYEIPYGKKWDVKSFVMSVVKDCNDKYGINGHDHRLCKTR